MTAVYGLMTDVSAAVTDGTPADIADKCSVVLVKPANYWV